MPHPEAALLRLPLDPSLWQLHQALDVEHLERLRDPRAATVLLAELGRARRSDLTLGMLQVMAVERVEVNVFHCSCSAAGCEQTTRWAEALQVLSWMKKWQLEHNEYTESISHKAWADLPQIIGSAFYFNIFQLTRPKGPVQPSTGVMLQDVCSYFVIL